MGGGFSCVQQCSEALAFESGKNSFLLNKKSHKKLSRSSDRGLGIGEVNIWEHLGAPEAVASAVTLLAQLMLQICKKENTLLYQRLGSTGQFSQVLRLRSLEPALATQRSLSQEEEQWILKGWTHRA